MSSFSLLLIAALVVGVANARIHVRSRRQVEREGGPAKEMITLVDKPDSSKDVPKIDEPGMDPNKDSEVVEVDYNENDGSLDFGGHFPGVGNLHTTLRRLFEVIDRRFRDMTFGLRRRFPLIPPSSRYPDNYNDTKTEEVTIDGRRFLKKETVVKKNFGNTKIFMTQISYVPVDEAENAGGVDIPPEKPAKEPTGEVTEPRETPSGRPPVDAASDEKKIRDEDMP